MKVTTETVQKITIADLDRLDPVALYLEDQGPGKGKVIITCYGSSWTAFWGSMGDRPVAEFIKSCSNSYLIGKLDPQLKDEVDDIAGLTTAAKKEIIKNRKSKDLRDSDAREWFDTVCICAGEDLLNDRELMSRIFGDEYWHSIPKKPNPDYDYLSRILDAVKAAISTKTTAKSDLIAIADEMDKRVDTDGLMTLEEPFPVLVKRWAVKLRKLDR